MSLSLPVCAHRVRIRNQDKVICMSPQCSGDPFSRPPFDEKYCVGCGFDKGAIATLQAPRANVPKQRITLDELVRRRKKCGDLKAAGLPCPDDGAVRVVPAVEGFSWAYGITTVPERGESMRLTEACLAAAGFPEPRIFVDGRSGQRVGAFGNWWLAAVELLALNPTANRFAIFQDDILVCRNLRTYLERWYPQNGYLNLIRWPGYGQESKGWSESPQRGKGAQGLVFSREALEHLLSIKEFVRVPTGDRGNRNIDGHVNEIMKAYGFYEWVHYPSLISHRIDEKSIIGNSKKPEITSFSLEFDPCASETR